MKNEKTLSVLSVLFAFIASALFAIAVLCFVYIVNMPQGFVSVLTGLYLFLVILVLLIMVIVFSLAGAVLSAINLKNKHAKALSTITFSLSAVFGTVSAGLIAFALISAYICK